MERYIPAPKVSFYNPPARLLPSHALFLDVDGTLLDFSANPSTTRASPADIQTLSRVRTLLGGALALVSGRSLITLDRIFEPMRWPAGGLHGLELRDADGASHMSALLPSLQFLQVVVEAKRLFGAYPGVVIEDKGHSLALHWRGMPTASNQLLAFAWDALRSLEHYRVQAGNQVIEICPIGPDKGDAISTFMRHAPFAGRSPVFIGDDLTDEPAFAAVNALGGVSILVGHRVNSAAQYALATPSAVWAWMGALT